MVKCNLCGNKIETTFLEKLVGTKVRNKFVCRKCQSKYGNNLEKELGFS